VCYLVQCSHSGIAGIDAIEIPQREDRNLGTIYLNFTSHLNAYNALNLINTEYKLHFYEATWASVSPERERKLNQELSDEDIEFYELSEKPYNPWFIIIHWHRFTWDLGRRSESSSSKSTKDNPSLSRQNPPS